MQPTTQLAPTMSIGRRVAQHILRLTVQVWQKKPEPATVMTYEECAAEISHALGCNCHGRCRSCDHLIKDAIGDRWSD